MSVPKYPDYKGSGIPWLGEIPTHWMVRPMLAVASERRETNLGMVESNLLSLSYGHIVEKDIASNDGLLPESFETYQIVNPGDTVFRLTDLQNDQRSLRSGLVLSRGIITSAYVAVCPQAMEPFFFSCLMRAYDVAKAFYSMGGGLRQSMKFSDLKRLPVLVPPRLEQLAISAFIKHETAKVDTLIAEQERLIELLKEKRQAVVSHAVTKGLNPNVPMKPSGVEWLGEVPQAWTVSKLGRVIFLQEGPGLRNWQFTDEGTRVICVTNITDQGIDFSRLAKFISTEEYRSSYQHFTVHAGDVLLSSSGNSWGKVAVYEGEEAVILNTSTIRLNSGDETKVIRDYIVLLLQSDAVREQLSLAMTGSCQPNFGPTHLSGVMVAIPSQEEQGAIVECLAADLSKLDTLTAETQRSISLLQERRSALISAAVTGQIDVRSFVGQEAA